MQMHVPMSKVAETLDPLLKSDLPIPHLIIHVLKDRTCFINLSYTDEHLVLLDQVTSKAIRHGGEVRADSRESLDKVSPYLAKRTIGKFNIDIQHVIKKAFDPHDVLAPNRLFQMREEAGKSLLQRAREENK